MTNYPLKENLAHKLNAFSGRALLEITPEAVDNGTLNADDLRIHADVLRQQADIARQAGFRQLAENLLRASELTLVPNDEVLKIYERLRPNRSSWEDLQKLADYLEEHYQATVNARFIREAAEVYKERNLLKR